MTTIERFPWQAKLFSPANLTHNVSLYLNFNGTEIQNNRFRRGGLVWDRLPQINLLDQSLLDSECPTKSYDSFTQCLRNHSKVFVWRGQALSSQLKLHGDLTMNEFVPHLIAVNNALLNRDGAIFDAERLYIRGGCADFAWHSWHFIYDSKMTRLVSYDEPVIALTQPYETAFAHELIDVYSNLIALRPILRAFPKIKILVRSRLGHTKYFPLLRSMGIEPALLNFIVLPAEQRLVHAPYIIAPLNYDCNVVTRHAAVQFSEGLSRLSNRSATAHRQILFHDRRYEETRRLVEGDEVFRMLVEEYGGSIESTAASAASIVSALTSLTSLNGSAHAILNHTSSTSTVATTGSTVTSTDTTTTHTQPKAQYKVVRYWGNESFEETVAKFSQSSVVVAAHGAGLVNMIFMHENTTVVEIRPGNFEVQVFDKTARSLHISH